MLCSTLIIFFLFHIDTFRTCSTDALITEAPDLCCFLCAAAAMSNTNIPAAVTKFILSKYCVILTMPFIPPVTLLICPISRLCDLQEYRWCWGAKHPLGLQQSQTEGSGGGKRSENDKHEHGGSWGQLKIAHRRGGASEGESAGTALRET